MRAFGLRYESRGLALYFFFEWKIALFTIFLALFWIGMGRKYARWMILKQCFEDSVFLKFALDVELVKLV